MLGSSSSSQRPQRHYSTKKVQSLLHASHPLTPWSYIWKKQIFSTGVISYSQVSNHEGPHQANIITSRGFVKIWQELLSPKHIFACCSKPRQDQGEAYRDTKRGLFKGLSWDNWAAHWEQGELETELHGVQCSGSHLGLKITQCYNCERLGKLEPEVLCKAKKVANGHWPSKDNDVTSQVKWKCWSSSGREGFFTTFLTTHCMCGRVVMWWVCGHVVMWVWVWVWVWAACLRTSYLFLPLPPPPAAAYWLSITDIVPEPSPVCIGQVLLLQTESVWFIHTESVFAIFTRFIML